MAFVAVLPTAGTILGGLGAAASAIPIIGGVAAPVLGGLGSAATALGAGNLMGAASSLGSGILGGGAGLIGGADKLLGGFLPNVLGGQITPQQGFLGQGGLGLIGGAGQFLGPGGLMGPKSVATTGVPAMNGILAPGVTGSAGAPSVPLQGFDMTQGLMPGAGGRPDGIKGVLHDVKGAVDPVLGPVTKVGVGLGKGLDIYNQLTGNGGGAPAGTTQTPAQAAQNPAYNPYVPTQKTQTQVVPVNVGAGAGGGGVPQAAAPQAFSGVPVASYVPMAMGADSKEDEEELEELKEQLALQGNFLAGVVNRTA